MILDGGGILYAAKTTHQISLAKGHKIDKYLIQKHGLIFGTPGGYVPVGWTDEETRSHVFGYYLPES
jgi:hypothetical protein